MSPQDRFQLPTANQTRTFDSSTVVGSLWALYVVAVVTVFLPESVPGLVTAPPVVLALTFVPGGLIVLLLFGEVVLNARTVLYTVGLSLLTLLANGFTINLLLPLVGVMRPLAPVPLVASVTLLVGVLSLHVLRRRPNGSLTLSVPRLFSPTPLALGLLPLLAILAVSFLNRTGNNLPILVLLAVFAVLPLVAVSQIEERWYSYVVWFLALGVLYHKSFWKNFGFSGSPGVIRAWEAQRWSPGVTEVDPYSTELLQNGVLFPTYAWFSGINIVTELEVVNPFLVAFIPLAVFVVARRYLGARRGLLAASLFIFAHPFFKQYPTAGRAATPVLFLSLFALVVSDDEHPSLQASALGIAFASGIIVTHYGTSYYVMVAIIGALVLLQLVKVSDAIAADGIHSVTSDWHELLGRLKSSNENSGRGTILSRTQAVFFAVGAIAWYMYATQGQKWKTLPYHILSTFQTMFSDGLYSGRTGARVARDYGSLPIRLSKYVYIVFGLLMGVGLIYVYYRRLVKRDYSVVDDRYLTLGSVMLGLFGLTFVARNWGGGRPMMITFTFTTTFAALGATVSSRVSSSLLREYVGERVTQSLDSNGVRVGLSVFAVLLVLLFSLNSGFASAVTIGTQSPSNVPISSAQESHREIDIGTHVWINNYGSGNVYGDPITHGQTDWYLPDIEIRTTGHRAYEGLDKPRGELLSLRESGVEPGYVMLLSHNIEEQSIVRRYVSEDYPLTEFQSELDQRDRIYTTGLSTVYYAPRTADDNQRDQK